MEIVERLRTAATFAKLDEREELAQLLEDAAKEIEALRCEVQDIEEGEDPHAGAWVREG